MQARCDVSSSVDTEELMPSSLKTTRPRDYATPPLPSGSPGRPSAALTSRKFPGSARPTCPGWRRDGVTRLGWCSGRARFNPVPGASLVAHSGMQMHIVFENCFMLFFIKLVLAGAFLTLTQTIKEPKRGGTLVPPPHCAPL